MTRYTRKITKEQYDRAMANKGYVVKDDIGAIFYPSEIFGYGVYDPRVVERNGEYYATFTLGSTCD